jgi:hypothetical protein
MKRAVIAFAAASVLTFTLPPLALYAQTTTQKSEKEKSDKVTEFWDKLRLSGASLPANFDGHKVMAELETKVANTGRKLSPREFWDELTLRGATSDAKFDAKKFFEDLTLSSSSFPAMVDVAARDNGAPSAEKCKAGWTAGDPWDQALFNRLCKNL